MKIRVRTYLALRNCVPSTIGLSFDSHRHLFERQRHLLVRLEPLKSLALSVNDYRLSYGFKNTSDMLISYDKLR